MCVIVHQPAGERLYKKEAIKLWRQNPDGGGFAYPRGKRIVTAKSMTFDSWWKHYSRAVKANPSVPFLIHMRIATHGSVNKDNTHPFPVDSNTVMAHNGVIWDCEPNKWDDRSDSRVFVEDVLPRLPDRWLDDEYLCLMVEAFVSSKLMFLTVDPDLEATVYRFGKWEKHRTLWMSNTYGLVETVAKGWSSTFMDKVDEQRLFGRATKYPDYVTSPTMIPDDDPNWVEAPSDEELYEEWMNGVIADYERREFHNITD